MTYAPMRARGAQTYANIGLQTGVASASPEKLISMLFEGARAAIVRAKLALERGDIPARGKATSQAIDIVSNGLKAALNLEVGGEIAQNLYELYDYIERSLLLANLHADAELLEVCDKLLGEIGGAWNDISNPREA